MDAFLVSRLISICNDLGTGSGLGGSLLDAVDYFTFYWYLR